MNTSLSIPVRTELFLELVQFLKSNNDPRDPVEVASQAISYWLDNASWKPELIAPSSNLGYQWKSLFLPDGTELRMQYKGTYHYARVVGDTIVYKDKPITPGSLANTVAGGSRNAWRDLWIKRPSDDEWVLADEWRARESTVTARDDLIDDL